MEMSRRKSTMNSKYIIVDQLNENITKLTDSYLIIKATPYIKVSTMDSLVLNITTSKLNITPIYVNWYKRNQVFDMAIQGWWTLFDNQINSTRNISSPIVSSAHLVSIMSVNHDINNQGRDLLIQAFQTNVWLCLLLSLITSSFLLSSNNFNSKNLSFNLFYLPFVLAFGAKLKALMKYKETSMRIVILSIIICSFFIKRQYLWQLNSLIVAKSKTFIRSSDQLFEKLDDVTPGMKANFPTIHILKSLNDTKWNAILSKTVEYENVLAFMSEKLNDIVEEKAVYISDTDDINFCIKLYPDMNLKLTEVEIQNGIVRSREFRYPISKDSSKFSKIYQILSHLLEHGIYQFWESADIFETRKLPVIRLSKKQLAEKRKQNSKTFTLKMDLVRLEMKVLINAYLIWSSVYILEILFFIFKEKLSF